MISKKKWLNVVTPLAIFALLITNGTKVCYLTLLAIAVCFPVFLLVRRLVCKEKTDPSQKIAAIVLVLVGIAAVALYPVTPRYKMEELKRNHLDRKEVEFAAEMDALGYNIYAVTLDDIFSDELLHEKFVHYYKTFVFGSVDPLGERFPFDRIITAYNGTVSSSVLGDTRDMKNIYVRFLFEDSDLLTRLFGIEYDSIGEDKINDLENDWFAILYYLGYFGFVLTIVALVFLFVRIFRALFRVGFTRLATPLNFTLLFGFCLQLGMAYFSGAVMRRPSASVYVALFIGLLFYNTSARALPTGKESVR